MIEILAHRANLSGPDPARENSLQACADALAQGFGLEIDLRRTPRGFVISHDPAPFSERNDLRTYAALFSGHRSAPLAVNIKELGYEIELVGLFQKGTFGDAAFCFDFELLEPRTPGEAQRNVRALPGGSGVRLAARLSDRGEPLGQCLAIPAEVVWADEFDRLWLTQKEIAAIHGAGRKVYAISPELHGFSAAERRARWADFKAWKVDGLCTDFPVEAREFFQS